MLPALLLIALLNGAQPAHLTAPEIVERMVRADQDRRLALAGYTCMRRYQFENKRSGKRAEMTVRMKCDEKGVKTFDVVTETGSAVIRNRILHKMLEAEQEASQVGEREQTRMIPANYDFQTAGTESLEGRPHYVLEVHPKTKNKFLIVGRIWVDADAFAITRIEGQPAKNPSFWVRSVHLVQRYEPTGRFWLPVMNESRAEARIFGTTNVSIESFDYLPVVHEPQARAGRIEGLRP